MKLSEIREIYNLSIELSVDFRELVENINDNSEDFEVDNYRFITDSAAFNDCLNMYEGDTYILGCFNDWFIAGNTDMSHDIVQTLQKAEQFDAIGQHIIDNGYLNDMIEEALRVDGVGHMLNSYDDSYVESRFNGIDYNYFKLDY